MILQPAEVSVWEALWSSNLAHVRCMTHGTLQVLKHCSSKMWADFSLCVVTAKLANLINIVHVQRTPAHAVRMM